MYLQTRLSCCLKCKKKRESKNLSVEEIKNGRIMFPSNFATCGSKNSRLVRTRTRSL